MKATHQGTCQACGRIQKLPKGVLAKHGFERPWGSRETEGCYGTNELPFELSCEITKDALKSHEELIAARTEDLRKATEGTLTEIPAWIREYKGETRFVVITPENFTTKGFREAFHAYTWSEVLDRYKNRLEWDIEAIEKEVARLRSLIENWAPKDLLPLG